MAFQDYTVVFDVTQEGYRQWTFPAFGLILVAAGLVVLIYELLRSAHKFKKLNRIYPCIFIGLALLWTLVSFAFTFGDYLILRNTVRKGRCEVVEGTVSNFVPMPREGHAMEHFTINGHYYEYSDFQVTAGFNHTQSHGGPIAEGRHVRICDAGGEIARLEVAW
jgi:hypothetical protein